MESTYLSKIHSHIDDWVADNVNKGSSIAPYRRASVENGVNRFKEKVSYSDEENAIIIDDFSLAIKYFELLNYLKDKLAFKKIIFIDCKIYGFASNQIVQIKKLKGVGVEVLADKSTKDNTDKETEKHLGTYNGEFHGRLKPLPSTSSVPNLNPTSTSTKQSISDAEESKDQNVTGKQPNCSFWQNQGRTVVQSSKTAPKKSFLARFCCGGGQAD